MGFVCHNDDIGLNDVNRGCFGLFWRDQCFYVLGSADEEAADQATPPTEAGEQQGPEPDADTVISGGNQVDHMSGSSKDELVYLDAGDDF